MDEKSRRCTQQGLLLQLLLSGRWPKGDCAREAPEWHQFTYKIQESSLIKNSEKRTILMIMSTAPGSIIKATKRRRKFWKTESLRYLCPHYCGHKTIKKQNPYSVDALAAWGSNELLRNFSGRFVSEKWNDKTLRTDIGVDSDKNAK